MGSGGEFKHCQLAGRGSVEPTDATIFRASFTKIEMSWLRGSNRKQVRQWDAEGLRTGTC